MKILGIVGSPRKENGRTYKVVNRVLKGASEEGSIMFLSPSMFID